MYMFTVYAHVYDCQPPFLPPPLPPLSQCVELFSSMVSSTHSTENIQYVLTQLSDLTEDEKTTVLLVKAAKGSACWDVCIIDNRDTYCVLV